MKKAYLISTGTELLLGNTIDSNSVYLSQQLQQMGIKVVGKSIVGDNREMIAQAFETGLHSAQVVIASGGLGPTRDDLTKEVLCEVLGCEMVLREEELEKIRQFFAQRKREMSDNNKKQAMFPAQALILNNHLGTAPGMYLHHNGCIVILLPGPPREMIHMYEYEAAPLLQKDMGEDINRSLTRVIKVLGPGESQIEQILAETLKEQEGYGIALLAVEGEVHIKITSEGEHKEESEKILQKITELIREKLDMNIVAYDDQTLAGVVGGLLKQDNLKLAAAESCTGGLLSEMLTDVPGSSQYFWGSAITYSNEAKKHFLGVQQSTLEQFGAVSRETAREMVQGIVLKSGADVGVAITGIAGPEGGAEEKPVGLVYIAVLMKEQLQVKELKFVGDRRAIRSLSAKTALDMVRRLVLKGGKRP